MSDSDSPLSPVPSSEANPSSQANPTFLDELRSGRVELPEAITNTPRNPGMSSISKYMQDIDIPSVFDLVPVDKYIKIATTVVAELIQQAETKANELIDPNIVRTKNEVLLVNNETGVVAFNERHFIPACDACIKACWSETGNDANTWFCRTLECDFETEENWPFPHGDQRFHIKPDGAWFRVAKGQNPKYNSAHTRCVSIYELKSTGIIYSCCDSLATLAQRILDDTSNDDTPVNTGRLLRGGPLSVASDPMLNDASEKLIKQAAAYAIGFRTQFVAMYDYLSLLLIRFDDFETSTTVTIREAFEKGGVRNRFKITVVTDRGEMIPALTGFLYEAQQEETGLGMASSLDHPTQSP